MDPLTAVGLASNVAQLIELSWKVVSKSHEIYRHGAIPEHRDLETVTVDLQKISDKLLKFLGIAGNGEDANADDEALRLLCESSNRMAIELIKRLIVIKPNEEHRSWKSIRQALKSVWIKSELDDMAARLQAFRVQLNTRILVSVHDKVKSLDQGNKNILQSIADSRVLYSTGQEIQTDYLTRLITSQHDRTQELLSNLTVASTTPPVYSRTAGDGGSSISPAAIDPKNMVFDAVKRGSIPEVRHILRDDPSIVLAYDASGQTLLHVAAGRNDAEMVVYLIRNGARINPDDDNGKLPIHEAVAADSEPIVRTLIAKGADSLAKDGTGKTARDLCDQSSLLHWIMLHGSQLEARNSNGATALHHFAAHGDCHAVRILLDQGADVETSSEPNRETPLWVASDRGHVEIVKMLLSHGANTESANFRQSTPLVTAGWHGYVQVGELLLDHGANIDAANQHDYTALAECCDHGRTQMGLMLLERGARFDNYNQWGATPLHQAALHGHFDLIKEMLDRGADVNVLDRREDYAALIYACEHGHLPIVELLLSRGANTEQWADIEGRTALMKAVEQGHTENVKVMVEKGKASLEARDKHGKTALSYAVDAQRSDTAAYLLSKGAD